MKKKIMIVIVAVVLILGAGIIYWRVDQDVPAGMKARIDFIDERRDDIRVYQSSYSDIDGREEITSWFFDKYDWDFKLKNYRTIKDLLFFPSANLFLPWVSKRFCASSVLNPLSEV